jgi:hypothetical protein
VTVRSVRPRVSLSGFVLITGFFQATELITT